MIRFYVSLIMVMLTCFGAGIEFAKFLYQKNKKQIYENLKMYFESKEGEVYNDGRKKILDVG